MQPWNMVVSHPEAGFWQGFEVGAIVFAFSAYIYILYFSLTAWKRHRSFAIGLIVSQSLLSLFSLSINVLLSYYAFPDPDTTLVPMALNDYFLALNSLLSAFFTANAIIVLTELSNPWNKLLYLLIAVIHFVMQGESYFNFMWNMANDSWVQSSIFTHDFLHQWALLEKYYLVLIHLWNTIPGPLMFLRIGLTRTKSLFGAFGYVMEQNHWFLPALVLRIIAIASGYTIDQIRVTSNWLGSDTNASSFGSLHYVTNSLKFMTHLYLLESVRQVVSRPVSHSHWSGQTIKTREYKESIALEAKH
ncbi:hypothetical protein EDD86DRAFT_214565 [Gorgonomyces haynaldii]|nr:hypothetical protein EDD86DRAFT_214565 [Gorgonomyces haynaldii]